MLKIVASAWKFEFERFSGGGTCRLRSSVGVVLQWFDVLGIEFRTSQAGCVAHGKSDDDSDFVGLILRTGVEAVR